MTQERKDTLLEEMLNWICEHIHDEEDLFLTLHDHFEMTEDELHEYSIDNLDCLYHKESPQKQLKQKILQNYCPYAQYNEKLDDIPTQQM